jgi:Rrf2 family transcriptional regulator, nitric oxide-sensitive transcriptional repressor
VKLTRYTDYALRVLLLLGRNPDKLMSIHELSTACGAPENHVMKVTPTLVRGGFIASARGRGGGLKLAKAPSEIRLGEVVRITEGGLDLGECAECAMADDCNLNDALSGAGEAFLMALDGFTLADVIAPRKAA